VRCHFILYVEDQRASTRWWREALDLEPTLDVDGMTEFTLGDDAVLGLMPAAGITRLLGPALPDPQTDGGVPRSEVYLLVDDPHASHERALRAGGEELSPVLHRDWGHEAGYVLTPDHHVLAFAGSP
jgi:hypothetical protein